MEDQVAHYPNEESCNEVSNNQQTIEGGTSDNSCSGRDSTSSSLSIY